MQWLLLGRAAPGEEIDEAGRREFSGVTGQHCQYPVPKVESKAPLPQDGVDVVPS
ncbi:MAG: hypothetical protein HRU39_07490 [Salinicola sp.]|nr:hypothetical protein [Salinicola sp.]NRB55810.1 hypothetical protein [Salinicola sp.]